MFSDCTSLTTAPELPATTLANWCYGSMFQNCTRLMSTPALPATGLSIGCYSGMFRGCANLTTAPELPAIYLPEFCYFNMFNGCTRLNYIKAMFKTRASTNTTENWVRGVSSTGTFVKNSTATWNISGSNGVPSGWNIILETP